MVGNDKRSPNRRPVGATPTPWPTFVVTNGLCLKCMLTHRSAQPLSIYGELTECPYCHEMAAVCIGPAHAAPEGDVNILDVIVRDAIRTVTPVMKTLLTGAPPTSTIMSRQ